MEGEASTSYVERLRQDMARLTEPLKAQYHEVSEEIEKRKIEIKELSEARTSIRTLIRSVEPTFDRTQQQNGNKPSVAPRNRGYSEERLQTLVDWLHENAEMLNAENEGQGFVATPISRQHQVAGIGNSQSTFSKMLLALHDQGVVRLNKVGGRSGREKFYKVVV
jgi:hypothetical protein